MIKVDGIECVIHRHQSKLHGNAVSRSSGDWTGEGLEGIPKDNVVIVEVSRAACDEEDVRKMQSNVLGTFILPSAEERFGLAALVGASTTHEELGRIKGFVFNEKFEKVLPTVEKAS